MGPRACRTLADSPCGFPELTGDRRRCRASSGRIWGILPRFLCVSDGSGGDSLRSVHDQAPHPCAMRCALVFRRFGPGTVHPAPLGRALAPTRRSVCSGGSAISGPHDLVDTGLIPEPATSSARTITMDHDAIICFMTDRLTRATDTDYHGPGVGSIKVPFSWCRCHILVVEYRWGRMWSNEGANTIPTTPCATRSAPRASAVQRPHYLVDTGLIPGPASTSDASTQMGHDAVVLFTIDPLARSPRTTVRTRGTGKAPDR